MGEDAIAKAKALTKKVRKTLMEQQGEVEPADPAALAEMQVKNLDKFAKKLKKQVRFGGREGGWGGGWGGGVSRG